LTLVKTLLLDVIDVGRFGQTQRDVANLKTQGPLLVKQNLQCEMAWGVDGSKNGGALHQACKCLFL